MIKYFFLAKSVLCFYGHKKSWEPFFFCFYNISHTQCILAWVLLLRHSGPLTTLTINNAENFHCICDQIMFDEAWGRCFWRRKRDTQSRLCCPGVNVSIIKVPYYGGYTSHGTPVRFRYQASVLYVWSAYCSQTRPLLGVDVYWPNLPRVWEHLK